MKTRRACLFILLSLLLLIGVPAGMLMRAYRQEQASRNLLEAIKTDHIPAALAALKQGADPDTRDRSDEEPISFRECANELLHKILHHYTTKKPDKSPSALLLYMSTRNPANAADHAANLDLIKALLTSGADPNLVG